MHFKTHFSDVNAIVLEKKKKERKERETKCETERVCVGFETEQPRGDQWGKFFVNF